LSCGSVCRSCVTVIARLASTHTALVSQSLVGLCFAFPSINHSVPALLVATLGTGEAFSRFYHARLQILNSADR